MLRLNSPSVILMHEQSSRPEKCKICGLKVKENYLNQIIKIPRSSFTAFRFCYASAEEISILAKTTLVGGIPRMWVKVQPSDSSKSSPSIQRRKRIFRRRASQGHGVGLSRDDNASLNVSRQHTHESSMKQFYTRLFHPDVMKRSILNRFKYDQDILQQEFLRQFDDIDSSSSSDSITSDNYDDSLKKSKFSKNSDSNFPVQGENALFSTNDFALDITSSLINYVPQYSNPSSPIEKIKSCDLDQVLRTTEGPFKEGTDVCNTIEAPNVRHFVRKTALKHQTQKILHLSKKLQFVSPAPECEQQQRLLREEIIKHEKLDLRVARKFKKLRQRKSQRRNNRQLRIHLIDRIKSFAEGEIVRLDKMLILVKQAPRIYNLRGFDEFSGVHTIIEEQWREYFVVLRRGHNDDGHLLVCQLYKTGKGRDFDKSPQFSFNILQQIRVEFYSSMDKSISVVQPIDTGTRIFIMSSRYYSLSLKWIYLTKGCLGEQFSLLFNVHAGITGQTFKVNLLRDVLKEAINPTEQIVIKQKDIGYGTYEDIIFLRVFRKIKPRLGFSVLNRQKQIIELDRSNFWLACKFNKRVEWISNINLSLLVMSQLFAKSSALELFPVPNDERIYHSSTVEGFLGQITKEPYSQFRSLKFDKVFYFFVSQNLLFITRLIDSVPPSPQNELLRPGEHRAEIATTIPEIFDYNLFTLDSRGHIPWLDSPGFLRKDRQALEEFSRKVTQAVKSKSVIDLCLVKEARVVHRNGAEAIASIEHLAPWLSNELGKDFMGAPFEIEFSNSSIMRLLAPSIHSRDMWVCTLNKSALFWRKFQHKEIASLLRVKESNQRKSRTTDALDLKSSFNQFGTIEETQEEVIPRALANSVLSMSSVVLCSGELFIKRKKRELFHKIFAVLCPGYLILFSPIKCKPEAGLIRLPIYQKQKAIPLSDCYIYTEHSTQYNENEVWTLKSPGQDLIPRIFPDGWKSVTESDSLWFTLWHGRKRNLSRRSKAKLKTNISEEDLNLGEVIKALKVRGKSLLFQARSRYELERWVHSIMEELNRFTYE